MAERQSAASSTAPEKELSQQIEQLRKDVLAITETLKSLGQTKAEDMKGNVKAKAAELAAAGRSKAEDLTRSAADLEADMASYVREKPVQSLAIAAVLGLIVGLISRRG
jgi:ElaB/YqjD/DUF883 family membrane-anchored ribosome-binding protein